MGDGEEETLLVASTKATRSVEFEHVQTENNHNNNEEEEEGDNVLVPSKGKPVIEIESETDKERRLLFEKNGRSLQSGAGSSNSQASPPRGSGSYSISLRFLTSTSSAQQASFEYAANRIGRLLTTKFTPVSTNSQIRCSFAENEILPSTIQELFIFVKIASIDGVGGVLGQASPCLEDRQGFARVGYMEFDSADVAQMVAQNTFDAVVVHEMMHIIGIGTLWETKGFVKGALDPRYHGQFGTAALSSMNGDYMGTPAVQDTGGEGTALSHWRENVFEDEMMTGFLSATFQPISRMTIESFRDLGFTVDSSAADAYTVKRIDDLDFIPLSATETSPPTFDSGSSSGSDVSVGLIVGIVVGGIVILIILSTLFKCVSGCCSRPARSQGSVTKGSSFPSQFSSQYPAQYPNQPPPPPPTTYPATTYGQYPVAQPVYSSNTTAGQYPNQYPGQYPTAAASFPNMNGGRQMAIV